MDGEGCVHFFNKFADTRLRLSGVYGDKMRAVDFLFPLNIQLVQLLKVVLAVSTPGSPKIDDMDFF
jgi:hypothetical protein